VIADNSTLDTKHVCNTPDSRSSHHTSRTTDLEIVLQRKYFVWIVTIVHAIRCLLPLMLLLVVLSPFTAHADERPSQPVPVSSRALGFGDEIGFRGHHDTVTLTMPVPDGLALSTLETAVQLPGDLARGRLDVLSDGVVLQRIPLPTDVVSVPLSIPLDRIPVRNGAATLTLSVTLYPIGETCPTDWTGRSVTLLDPRVVYTGTDRAPTTVAEFMPPILERVELALPDEPTAAESGAAVSLTTAIGARYTGRAPEIVVVPPAPNSASDGGVFTRRIVIRENDETPQVRVLPDQATPTLEVTGTAAGLAEQIRALRNDLSALAVQDTVTFDGAAVVAHLAATDLTFDEVGIGTASATSIGVATVEFGVDQTRIGGRVHDLRLELRGVYTPASAVRTGIVTVAVGGRVIDSWPADSSGVIDRTVVVPDDVLTRVVPVTVSLQTSGDSAGCGLDQPVTIQLDGDSRVVSAANTTGTGADFTDLPQGLLPDVQVAADGTGRADTGRAVELLAELQALSTVPLNPEWVAMDDALTGEVPAVIVSARTLPQGLDLPLTLTGGRTLSLTVPEGPAGTVTFPTDVDFASLQVLEDRDRLVLVASATSAASELDRTLAWLSAEPGRWDALTGDVVFTAPDQEPIVVATTTATATANSDTDDPVTVERIMVLGGILVAAGLIVAAMITGGRRLRSGRTRP